MSASNIFEENLLDLIFLNTNADLIGDATGLRGASTAGSLYVSLHSSDPLETGSLQTANEISYTGYARVAVARSGAGWARTNSSVSPVAAITFGACTGGSATVTYFGIGTDASGGGKLLLRGLVNPTINVSNGVTPQISTSSTITLD